MADNRKRLAPIDFVARFRDQIPSRYVRLVAHRTLKDRLVFRELVIMKWFGA